MSGITSAAYHMQHGCVEGLGLRYVGASSVQVLRGSCRDSTHVADLDLMADQVVDLTVSGVGGLDTGSEAPSTFYYVYLVKSAETMVVGVVLSASASAPTMTGWSGWYRRIGSIWNQADGHIAPFLCMGMNRLREYRYQTSYLNVRVLNGAGATSYTDVALGAFIPETARAIYLQVAPSSLVGVYLRPNGYTGDVYWVRASTLQRILLGVEDGSRTIAYRNDAMGGAVDLYVEGWVEEL